MNINILHLIILIIIIGLIIKSNYTEDKKYLAVVTNNGLWIKDIYNENISTSRYFSRNYFRTNNVWYIYFIRSDTIIKNNVFRRWIFNLFVLHSL